MALGIYKKVNSPIAKGAIVGACIPESYETLARERSYLGNGVCENGLRPVMKEIVAMDGDSLEITSDGVVVNGESIENTKILNTDAQGRYLPNQI